MSLWRIVWRYIWSRPLVTTLTLISVALGCALIAAVLTLRRETERTLVAESSYYDMVVGAKGSPLQLVLSSVYHLDIPTGNIPLTRYETLQKDPRVKWAAPIGLGDNYRGFRIVGTEPVLFTLKVNDGTKRPLRQVFHVAQGKLFEKDFEAVLGASVAAQSHLKVGDTFVGVHGLVALAGSQEHKEFPYKVVGILAPDGSSVDRAIYVSMASVWLIHEREAQLHHQPVAERQVTAVLLQLKFVGLRLSMNEEIKNKTESMAAIPVSEMAGLNQNLLAPLQKALLGMAGLVVVVAALSILAALYQATERRRREVAVMRALGAHPVEIWLLIVLEAVILTLCGIVAGWLLGHGGVAIASTILQRRTGMVITNWSYDQTEMIALGIVALVGAVAGMLPHGWFTAARRCGI